VRVFLQGLESPFKAARYHSLVIDQEGFPDSELEVTARTGDGTIMAVRHRRMSHIQVKLKQNRILLEGHCRAPGTASSWTCATATCRQSAGRLCWHALGVPSARNRILMERSLPGTRDGIIMDVRRHLPHIQSAGRLCWHALGVPSARKIQPLGR